jgi:MobA/VirD2-like, nuclease domain
MIVKISGAGKSFKGLSDYLTHDPNNAKTDERVAWTHTLNCANDHIPSAVNEMYLTAENAELLKQQAGIRAGGRATENPVIHVSLNWAPADQPTREHMIETSEQYLRHMGWQQHQAVLIAHEDKSYQHVHIMLNAVHPETGLRLDDGFEQRRSQSWALGYEREQDRIHCPERLKNVDEREKNMPRNIWMDFRVNQQEFERAEKNLADNSPDIPENPKNAEWRILKDFQKEERIAFFAKGKSEFGELRTAIFREVREEFRERWNEYYELRRSGADHGALASMKAQLVADEKAVLEPRRDAACKELRESRDERYSEILDHQKEQRAELHWCQELGLDNAPFLSALEERRFAGNEIQLNFREAAREATASGKSAQDERSVGSVSGHGEFLNPAHEAGLGKGAGRGAYAITNTLFMAFMGEAPRPPMSAEDRETLFREAAENATKQHQQHARDEEDDRRRDRQRELYRE